MPTITIDNKPVTVADGTTILDAATQLGIAIPTLCYLRGVCSPTSCLACVVKVNGRARLVPACATAVAEGMVVESSSEEVQKSRRMALELLLSDHLGDCVGPCQSICPAHMDIPTMIRQINAGDLRGAVVTVKERIPFPATLGRICPEICEKGCRRVQQDSAVSICKLKRFVGDTDLATGKPYQPACRPATGKKVAVIGAGPAGLSAAYYLLRQGHAVAVIDAHKDAGGNLRYGVPEAKLPRTVLDDEIKLIVQLGAQLRLGETVSNLKQLTDAFDAVLLAAGELTPDAIKSLGLSGAGKGVKVDKATLQTSIPGVFAAGSAVTSSQHAVRAVGSGYAAARSIGLFLTGAYALEDDRPFTVHIGKLHECEVAEFMVDISPAARVEPKGDGFTAAEAVAEGERCMKCDCLKVKDCAFRQVCADYDADTAAFRGERREYRRELTHPEVVFEPGKCIACGRCMAITERAKEPLGLTFIGRGFTVRTAVPFSESLRAGLTKVALECADACPTAALARKK